MKGIVQCSENHILSLTRGKRNFLAKKNFLLIHAKNKYKDRDFARDTRSFYANDGGLFYMIIFSSDTPLF